MTARSGSQFLTEVLAQSTVSCATLPGTPCHVLHEVYCAMVLLMIVACALCCWSPDRHQPLSCRRPFTAMRLLLMGIATRVNLLLAFAANVSLPVAHAECEQCSEANCGVV